MKLSINTIFTTILLFGAIPGVSSAALPLCQSTSSDSDGDGFGWENNASCLIALDSGDTSKPECTDPDADSDGDGYGWQNNASCVVVAVGSTGSTSTTPFCSNASFDADGDGYGWENNASCIVVTTSTPTASTDERPACSSNASDTDNDGFGWENNTTCIVSDNSISTQPEYRSLDVAYPYRPDSPYADSLKRCALISEEDDSCRLNELSFIGSDSSDPTVNDIMNRVVVTHDWMGRRFERLLNSAPDTLINLFQSVAVIAIGSDVRPSSYSILNGLVRIDPYYLWMSVDEKQTIDPGEDFRSNFGADLKFGSFRIFERADGSTYSFPSLSDDTEREYSELIEPAVSLLFHELAHAVDFAPAWTLSNMNLEDSFYDAIINNADNWLSSQLQAIYPNQVTGLTNLAGVRFFDDTPTQPEVAVRSAAVGAAFENDGATSFYSYSTIREDFANLVEAAMMKYHYNTSLSVYFYDIPTVADPSCTVGWGVVNRIANPSVLVRAEWAVDRSVGTTNAIETFFADGAGVEVSDLVGVDLCSQKAKGPRFSSRLLY